MKTSPIDYVLSTIFLTLLTLAGLAMVALSSPWTRMLLGDYHVIAGVVVFLVTFGVLAAVVVRLIVRWRPIPNGTHSMDHAVFTTWKLVTVIYHFGQTALKPVTPIFLKPLVAILYGARIGRDVALGGTLDPPFMITLGDRAVIGAYSLVSANFMAGDTLIFGPVKVGVGATIGVNAVVFPNTEIGDGATLMGGSYLMPGNRIPAGETWRGNPARRWVGGSGASRDS